MKVTFRRGRKIGDPGYSSTDVGLEFSLDVGDEVFENDEAFAKFVATQYSFADQLLEAEVRRIYASRPKPVETAAERDERDERCREAGRERAIDEARSRREPAAVGSNGVDHSRERPRSEMERSRNRLNDRDRDDRERPRDDRDRGRDDRGRDRDDRRGGGSRGGQQGPPRSGKRLFAWAKGIEEEGRVQGLIKWLNAYGKKFDFPARFVDWTADEIKDAYEEASSKMDRDEID